jgi:hypothetical protein
MFDSFDLVSVLLFDFKKLVRLLLLFCTDNSDYLFVLGTRLLDNLKNLDNVFIFFYLLVVGQRIFPLQMIGSLIKNFVTLVGLICLIQIMYLFFCSHEHRGMIKVLVSMPVDDFVQL